MKTGPVGWWVEGKRENIKVKVDVFRGGMVLEGQLRMAGEAAIGFIYFIMITASLK